MPQKFRAELFSLTLAASALFTRSPMDTTHPNSNSPEASDNTLPALSPRQLAARRANAQKSTGPRTSEGKAVVAFNALKHGFFSADVVNPRLDGPAHVEAFNSILDALLDDFQPQSARERILVDEVAACCWRIRRLLRFECREAWAAEDADRRAVKTESPTEALQALLGYDNFTPRKRLSRKFRRAGLDSLLLPDDPDVEKIIRFERGVKRNLFRALAALERIQASRIFPGPLDKTVSSQHEAPSGPLRQF